jgi:p-aminobenzoyl-glutamate transporter AbgT
MKPWKLFPSKFFTKALATHAQRGQSIVEFVLLLFVITTVSYGFVALMNKNLARYWEYSASLIVNDVPGKDERFKLTP